MLINISADQVLVLAQGVHERIPYKDLERTLPAMLLSIIGQVRPSRLLVLNGPGSFTSLRIWCLTVNLLKQYGKLQFDLYEIGKLPLYQAAFQAGVLPQQMGIFLGQKQNCRSVDLASGHVQKVTYKEIWDAGAFDRLADPHPFLGEAFPQEQMISFERTADGLVLSYQGNFFVCTPIVLGLTPTKKLVANYEIAPTLG